MRTIYLDGLAPGWRSESYGCLDCEFDSKAEVGTALAGGNAGAWGGRECGEAPPRLHPIMGDPCLPGHRCVLS